MVCRNEWKYVADVVTEFGENRSFVECLPGELQLTFSIRQASNPGIADVFADTLPSCVPIGPIG